MKISGGIFGGIVLGSAVLLSAATAQGGSREKAILLFSRLTGVVPSESTIIQMKNLIDVGNLKGAAQIATLPANDSFYFYNLNLPRMAKPLTNVDINSYVDMNDFVATFVGMVRDDFPFDQSLSVDRLYRGVAGLTGVAAYAVNSNNHYQQLEGRLTTAAGGLDLRASATLEMVAQSAAQPQITDTAGLLTTRAFGSAFLSAGTNRRATRFAFIDFLCKDIPEVADTNISDDRVRRDVSRYPTGDHTIYQTQCSGCHKGLDAMSGAWAFFNFSDQITQGGVQNKMNQNGGVYPSGFQTSNNSWLNYWDENNNVGLGWRGPATSGGNGVRALGEALQKTEAFSKCMAKRAFRLVCLREPSGDESGTIVQLATSFEADNYNLRELIEDASILPQCMMQ
ncbi:MAG: DUF1585 domain-containing protein [Bacteriovoracia bacterium]